MNNLCKRTLFLSCFCLLIFLSGCATKESFIGLNRQEVVKRLEQYPRFSFANQQKIMICCNSVFKYYNNIDEILDDKSVMDSKEWDIAFKKTFWGKKYIKVYFVNNIVTKQANGYLNDGP